MRVDCKISTCQNVLAMEALFQEFISDEEVSMLTSRNLLKRIRIHKKSVQRADFYVEEILKITNNT